MQLLLVSLQDSLYICTIESNTVIMSPKYNGSVYLKERSPKRSFLMDSIEIFFNLESSGSVKEID